ncbi:nucleotidyltransferase [Sporosarcina sp. CAU 1771]
MTPLKATGIIVEYNPYHNGHKYHATKARHSSQADVIIAVMSGNFLQRGEPAFVDKWARAKMALLSGVDIVFELPYAFATAHAPSFAKGAIQLLDAAHCDAFCFGSEDGTIQPFEQSLALIQQSKNEYEHTVKDAVSRGLSYPKALNEAYLKAVHESKKDLVVADLTKPNNILGFHYMQAVQELGSQMEAITIPRIVAGYHDDSIKGNSIASATGIRKTFFETDELEAIDSFYPDATHHELQQWQKMNCSFGSWELFYPLLRFTLLREGPVRIACIADITEGIENLMYRAAANNSTFKGFMNEVKSKRYTWTRIQRMLTHIFTGYTYEMRSKIEAPSYLRLLGMTNKGRIYLNENKKQFKLPLVSKAAAFSDPSLSMDIKASTMYALAIGGGSEHSRIRSDYSTHPIYIQQ